MPSPEETTFASHGIECAAYLYRPEATAGNVPCVVMAHGFSSTRDDLLPTYAERFAAAGYAVLVFDYRHFGASAGSPRQLLNVGRQQHDYRAAIGYARGLEGVDPDRIVLWGTSFSGGHVVAVAATDPNLAAVIAQVPFADGVAAVRQVPPTTMARLAGGGIRDALGALAGRPPYLLPAVGPPGSTAAMTTPDAEAGVRAILGEGSLWRNAVAARLALTLGLYRPVTAAGRLTMPLLVCVCEDDRITPPAPAVEMATRAPRGEVRRYSAGHFDIYQGELFETAVSDQIAFLERHVGRSVR